MNLSEYNKIKDLTYRQYCTYLQKKYGVGDQDYMKMSAKGTMYKNKKCTRTSEGLVAHHIFEDTAILLCKDKFANECPFEWQKAENLVFCDYLEHFYLHTLICEYPSPEAPNPQYLGHEGAICFLIPELNDWYCGFIPSEPWKLACRNLIIKDSDVYLTIMKRFFKVYGATKESLPYEFFTSYNARYGLWDKNRNHLLYEALEKLID